MRGSGGVGRADLGVVRFDPARFVVTGSRREAVAAIQVGVLARARQGRVPPIPSIHELTEAPHGHCVLVQPEATHSGRIGFAGRPAVQGKHAAVGAGIVVCPIKSSSGDFQTHAATFAARSTIAHSAAARRAARLQRTGIGGSARAIARIGSPGRTRRCAATPTRRAHGGGSRFAGGARLGVAPVRMTAAASHDSQQHRYSARPSTLQFA